MLCHECGSTIEDGQKDRAPVLARLCLKCRSDLRRRYNVKFPRCCRTQRMLSTVDSRFVPRFQYVTAGAVRHQLRLQRATGAAQQDA